MSNNTVLWKDLPRHPLDTTEHCPRHTIWEGNWRVIMGAYGIWKATSTCARKVAPRCSTKVLRLMLWSKNQRQSFQSVFAEARWRWTRLGPTGQAAAPLEPDHSSGWAVLSTVESLCGSTRGNIAVCNICNNHTFLQMQTEIGSWS